MDKAVLLIFLCLFCVSIVACASFKNSQFQTTNKYPITDTGKVLSNGNISDLFDPCNEVRIMKKNTPDDIIKTLESSSPEHLRDGIKFTYIQDVKEFSVRESKSMVIELTRILIDVPYQDFIKIIPPEMWGKNLADYLGGEIKVIMKDEHSRATHQIERMVLNAPIKNLDMTKTEIIEYGLDSATIYWRVFRSDNNTTISDIGYVEFSSSKTGGTIVTFHSAHRLYLPNFIVKISLANTFIGHLKNYRKIVLQGKNSY